MIRKTLFPFLLIAIGLAASSSPALQTTKPVAAAPVSVPFDLVTRHIVLQVKVNNSRPLSFVLDTGDRVGIIDIDVAKELGLKLQGQVRVGGAGSETLLGSTVQDATWTLPALEGFSQPIRLAIPLARLESRFGHDFDGIIGAEFIKQFVIEIDYAARVIKLHDKDKFSYAGPGESIPIQLDQQGHPILEAEVTPLGGSPIRGKFILDIGAGSALALHSPFVSAHQLLNSNLKTIRSIGAGGAGGQTLGRVGRVAELKIGKFTIANPITIFSEDKAGAFASTALAGNIGQQIASKFKLFLDYDHQQIIFQPAATFNEPFDRAQSGLVLAAEGRDYTIFRITDILENSPASEVGLQKDDVIIKVNDKPASELTMTKLGELFERAATYRITIRRGDQTLQVTLTPRKLV
ncbi:MAG TPA: aspartyl protease family protein [Pyrinomonadaceae bacterium]|nr:aspartyl protease family protein [Pyrinomonadaceae bacterium]